ncbi:hypothetical protein [Streptomyces viridochromogenes]|uniref:hypothetical protein n=1 Tax=Streptomyces viridochromogenes TaxID=1938 RepID=UPI00069E74CA|nr:hypothetical protein [Streptomyces viridochromogenes]KOG26797.1 hypothetical protein ADK36_02225 [Streptomyces viridochromogenes]
MKNLRDHIELTEEKAQIDADMQYAVTLEFGPYLGYLGAYGQRLDRMASEYRQHEIARRILTAYADEALDRANGN